MLAKCIQSVLWILAALAVVAPCLYAERLAVHTYTVADGLAGDQVTCITRDRQGFLWIGTRTGLSRFDGVSFRSFDTSNGLPHAGVYEVLESSDGTLWFGTAGGLVRIRGERAADGSAFEKAEGIPGSVSSLAEDESGDVWVASRGALYRLQSMDECRFAEVETQIPWPTGRPRSIGALEAADGGGLWLGTSAGLFHLQCNGSVVHYQVDGDQTPWRIHDILQDSEGRVWVAGRAIRIVMPEESGIAAGEDDHATQRVLNLRAVSELPVHPGEMMHVENYGSFANTAVFGLDQAPDGAIWAASHRGLEVFGAHAVASHNRSTGLVSDHLGPVLVDETGNAWIGTQSHGLMRVNSTGFTSYTEEDGLVDRQTASVTLGPQDEIVVITLPPEGTIHVRDGEAFLALHIPLPNDVVRSGWGLNQVSFFDHEGKLWVPTPKGLFRFPQLDDLRDLPHTRHERRYLPEDEVYRVFEDSRGDLWLGVFGDTRLFRWQRSTDTLHRYGIDDGIPNYAGTAFAEDGTGAVWIGFYSGGLARWRDGAFRMFDDDIDLPVGFVNCVHFDHRGRMWVGAQGGGLAFSDNPTVKEPHWRLLTSKDGLASDGIFSLAEDRFGRIYAGSLKGVDRLDPGTGQIDHFDTSTGLVNNLVLDALSGPNGDIWFATDGGVSRYRPGPEGDREVPAVVVDRVTVDGVDLTVPLRGVSVISPIFLPSRTEVIDIGFASVDLTPGSRLAFEVAVGSETETWSPTHGERFVRLAGLAPGNHNVLIRARLPDGSVGEPATVDFQIAMPFWRRWWFLVSVAAALAGAAWLVQHWRIQRLMELQRVRSRIAADLHDEMGLSLVRVAILADVAGQDADSAATSETLHEIGRTTRDLVDATSDMAWALDPRHDTVAALVARFRRMAVEVVEGSGGRFVFDIDPLDGVAMGSEDRRHLLLILKEAIRNACQHGRPKKVSLTIRRRSPGMLILLEDDGAGFAAGTAGDGQGLLSMKRRAAEMGAVMVIDSTPGTGTRITLEIPFQ